MSKGPVINKKGGGSGGQVKFYPYIKRMGGCGTCLSHVEREGGGR